MFWVDCPEVPDNGTGNGTGNGNGNGVPPITGLPPTGGAAPQSQGGTGWALGLLAAVFSGIVAAGLRVTKGISRL